MATEQVGNQAPVRERLGKDDVPPTFVQGGTGVCLRRGRRRWPQPVYTWLRLPAARVPGSSKWWFQARASSAA